MMDVRFQDGAVSEVTVDSGAEESVCPWEWGSQFPVKDPVRRMSFKDASGGDILHYGSRDVVVVSSF